VAFLDSQHVRQDTDFRFNNALLENYGAETVIAAASRQSAGRIGLRNDPPFLWEAEKAGHMFARMQRVRSFTEYQQCFSETPVKSFVELTGDKETAAILEKLYNGKIEDVELVVGLFAQRHDTGSVLPSLMRTMVAVDAFSQILTNPLLSANVYGEAAFSAVGLKILEQPTTFADLVARNRDPAYSDPIVASFAR
jgi:prostaglandin-endoperoxide synthase 2